MSLKISRHAYAEMFGPTTGDRVRLADTDLFIEVEKDLTVYGEEVKFGGGKVIRDGMGQSQRNWKDCADTVITNALIVDYWGIVKADIGIKRRPHRRHRQSGQSRHPARRDYRDRRRDRDHRGRGHDRHAGRHRHAYPFHLPAANRRSADVGRHDHARRRHRARDRNLCDDLHAGPWHMLKMLEAAEAFPMNLGFLGKGQRELRASRCASRSATARSG